MPYTDPKKDIDVSGGMASGRMVEGMSSRYFGALSRECCANGGLMLDVGANFGYYSLLAASQGRRVVAWEPVPVFRAFLELGVRLNNFSHLVHVRAAAVSNESGKGAPPPRPPPPPSPPPPPLRARALLAPPREPPHQHQHQSGARGR